MDSSVHWLLFLLFMLELFFLGSALYQSNSPLVTVTKDELRSLNASCGGLDTCRCRYKGDDSMHIFSCQCGDYCIRYGTCCMDAPAILKGEVMEGYSKGLDCAPAMPNYYDKPVHIVQKCPKEWDGDDSVRDLCVADALEKSDLMLMVPVSSLKTGITYRNYFCYVCNTVDELNDSFISWNIQVIYANLKESLFEDLSTLTFDPEEYRWTFPGAPKEEFYLRLVPPSKLLENFSIFCRERDVISSCAEDWTDDVTRAKCGYYTALVNMVTEEQGYEGYQQVYRNVHCGICNWANLETIQCTFASRDPTGPFEGSAKVFREIFRISEMRENRCPEGKIYDKVTKNCRNFRCGRKMELVRGRCVRKK